MRPQILLLIVAPVLLPLPVFAAPAATSTCRSLPTFFHPIGFPYSQPLPPAIPNSAIRTTTATVQETVQELAKSGQGDRALETARTIQDDYYRAEVAVDLIDQLTTDDQLAQAIALLGTTNIGWKPTRFNRLAAEKLALKGRLPLAMQALDLISDADERRFAVSDLVAVLLKKGQRLQALELVQRLPDTDYKNNLLSSIAIALGSAGQLPRGLEVAQMISSEPSKLATLLLMTKALSGAGQTTPARTIAETIPTPSVRAQALHAVVGGLLKTNQMDDAVQIAQTIESCELRATTFSLISKRYRELKQPKQAAAVLDSALPLAAASDRAESMIRINADLANEYGQLGQRQQALRLLAQALKQIPSIQAVPGKLYPPDFPQSSRAVSLSRVAKEYRLLGEQKQALQSLGDALKMVQTFKPTWLKVEQLRAIAAEYKALGQPAKAAALSAQANKIAPAISLPAPAKIPLTSAPARIPFPTLKPRSAPKLIVPRSIILPAPVSR